MGNRQTDISFLWIILLSVIASPFVFLYNFLGATGFILVFIVTITCGYWFYRRYKYKEYVSFQDLALYTLTTRTSPEDFKRINMALMRYQPQRFPLIRNLQIIGESIDIALHSKKRETAVSRMKLAIKLWKEIDDEFSHLLSKDTIDKIDNIIKDAITRYQTIFYVNQIQVCFDKISTLKTEKAKLKYIELSNKLIYQGFTNKFSDKTVLETLKIKLQSVQSSDRSNSNVELHEASGEYQSLSN